ncbi:MAG: tetratricopeptide repeat protein, partial [Deltaproteobacteria bacterium]|nr:tetratricopeptide repeat protein [Deltaproteobacteria bacterium]
WNARRRPLVAVGVGWYFLLIAPSTFVHLNTVLMENRGYTASMGVAVVLGWLGCAAWRTLAGRRRRAAGALCGVVLAAFALIGWQRQQVWATNLAVWEDAVEHDPSSNDAVLNLGARYVMAGRLDEAAELFKILVARSPEWHAGGLNLAHVYLLKRDYGAARALLEPMVAGRPQDPGPLAKLAQAHAGLNRTDDAIALYRRAIDAEIANLSSRVYIHEVVPGEYPEALMEVALRAGREADARWALMRFAQSFPGHPRGYLMEMKLHAAAGRWAEAGVALDRLARLLPGDARVPQWRTQLAAMRRAAEAGP